MTQKDKDLLIKDICARLPYKPKFYTEYGILELNHVDLSSNFKLWFMSTKSEVNKGAFKCQFSGRGFRTGEVDYLLHPMSDLVKPNPKTGVSHIVELAMLTYNDLNNEVESTTIKYNFEGAGAHVAFCNCKEKDGSVFVFGVDVEGNVFNWKESKLYAIPDQIKCFDYLNLHMFDYRGLIEKRLAIDINTIEK